MRLKDFKEFKEDETFGRAVSGLKAIFDSGETNLISAIQDNIYAFQLSIPGVCQTKQQASKTVDLDRELEEHEKRILALEALDKKPQSERPSTTSVKRKLKIIK